MSLLLMAGAQAQGVYRCGNAYSQHPCGPGERVLDVRDERSAAQQAEARQAHRRDDQEAQALARQRARFEAMLPSATGLRGQDAGSERAAGARRGDHRGTQTREAPFRAVGPSSGPTASAPSKRGAR